MRAGCSHDPVREALASDRKAAALPFLPTLVTALVVASASFLCRPTPAPESRSPAPAGPAAATAEAARLGGDGFHTVILAQAPAAGTAETIPATLAFARLHPPAFVTNEAAQPASSAAPVARPTQIAVQAPAPLPAPSLAAVRRVCAGTAGGGSASASRCAEPRRGETARALSGSNPARPEAASAAAQPFPVRPETPEAEDGFLPGDILPKNILPKNILPKDALPYAATAASWVDGVRRFGGRIGSSVGREAAALGGSVVELFVSAR